MIAHLVGKILFKNPGSIVIDVGGVGYEAAIPLSTFYELGDAGSPVALHIHTHIREDALQLFGFRSLREKEVFLRLVSVGGIGPKLAITILSGVAVSELITAIQSNDLARLTSIPGVGKKTAERLVIELRDKLASIAPREPELGVASGDKPGREQGGEVVEDTIAALVSLGYQKPVAERAVAAALVEAGPGNIEELLKRSLRRLAR